MKVSKEQIRDGIGTVTINGNCSDIPCIEVYINNVQVYSGKVSPKEIKNGTLNYSGQQELVTFDFKLNPGVHYDSYKIVCTNGTVQIGAIHEHFHKDIIPLGPKIVQRIYHNRLDDSDTPNNSYIFYYKEENDMLRNKVNAKINDYKIEYNDPGHIAGWLYKLEQGDELTFAIDSLTPNDAMSFIVNAKPGPEYFLKEYK